MKKILALASVLALLSLPCLAAPYAGSGPYSNSATIGDLGPYSVTPTGGTADTLANWLGKIFTNTPNTQSGDYTLALADNNNLIRMNKATAQNLTIPLNANVSLPIGYNAAFSQTGAGALTLVAQTATASGNTHTNTTVDNLSDTSKMNAGLTITGTDIPASTTIVSVDSSSAITISQAATGTHSGSTFTVSPTINHSSTGLVMAGQYATGAVKKTAIGTWLLVGNIP